MTKLLKKKWISYLTLAVMLISLLASFSISTSAEVDGKKHYHIANATQWNTLAANVTVDSDTVIHLYGNLDFTKVGLTQFDTTFAGTLEGNGKTITIPSHDKPIFKAVSGTLKDFYVTGTYTGTSGVVLTTLSGAVENVGVYSTLTGGGSAIANRVTGTIKGCFYSGTGGTKLYNSGNGSVTYSVLNNTAYTTTTVACSSVAEAAWTVSNTGKVYFTDVDTAANSTVLGFGTSRDRFVKVTVDNVANYYDSGYELTLDTVDGKTPVQLSGNGILMGQNLTVMSQDIVIEYQDADAVTLAQRKAELQKMVDSVSHVDFSYEYFTSEWQQNLQTWLPEAEALLENPSATAANLKSKYDTVRSAAINPDAGYVPAKYYDLYQRFYNITNYSISDKEDWLRLTEAVNYETVQRSALTLGYLITMGDANRQINLYLTNDIDMQGEKMIPLCNGGTFAGNLNGNGFAFKNINMDIESPFGPVGLIGILSGKSVVQNLRVEGSVTIKGRPIYIASQVGADYVHEGNRVAGIAGSANGGAVIRKCLANVNFSVANAGNCGGILADTRSATYVDGCIVLGDVQGVGIVGEGGSSCRVYNSIYGGQSGIIKYHKGVMGNVDGDLTNRISNCYSFSSPIVWRGTWTIKDAETGDNIDLWTTEVDNYAKTFTQDYMTETFQEAAYKANLDANYIDTGKGDGERIYFTLDANGLPTFGTAENQIIKLDVQDPSGTTIDTYYAPSTGTLKLNHERGRNYYAIKGDEGESYIKGQTLYTKNAPEGMKLKTAENVDSGNVYGAAGTINLADAQMVLRGAVGLSTVDEIAGDVNFNAKLDVNDAVLIVRKWMGDTAGYNPADHTVTSKDGWYTVASYNIKVMDWDGPAPELMEGLETGNGYHSYATTGLVNHSLVPLADEVAAVIKSVGDIDLLGMQEVNSYNTATLQEKLGGTWNAEHTWASRHSSYDYGTSVMSPHTIDAATRVQYDNQYGVLYAETIERRSYGRFEVTLNKGQADALNIIWYNTHLGNVVEQQFEELMAAAQEDYANGEHVVITADFNYWPTGMQKYLGGNFTMANGGEIGKNFEATTAVTGTAIDNIVISNNLEFYYEPGVGTALNVVSFDDLSDSEKTGCDQTWASDHNLVYAYIRKK